MKKYYKVPVYIFKENETNISNINDPNKTANIIINIIAKKIKNGFKEIKTGRCIIDLNNFPETKYYVYIDIKNELKEDGAIMFIDTSFGETKEIANIDIVKDYLNNDLINDIFDEYDKTKEKYKNNKIKTKQNVYIQIKETIKYIKDNYKTDKLQNKEIKKLIKDYKNKGE